MRRANAAVFLGVLLAGGVAVQAGPAEGAQKVRLTMPVTALSMTPVYVAKSTRQASRCLQAAAGGGRRPMAR